MEKHFSKISTILNDHLSFMVQDLDVVFANCNDCKSTHAAIHQTSATFPGVASCVEDNTVPTLEATGMSPEEIRTWVSTTFRPDRLDGSPAYDTNIDRVV